MPTQFVVMLLKYAYMQLYTSNIKFNEKGLLSLCLIMSKAFHYFQLELLPLENYMILFFNPIGSAIFQSTNMKSLVDVDDNYKIRINLDSVINILSIVKNVMTI